ncbi:metalloregulator ArsR/SmtB family transcription factor [Sneathiella chungangensis]|uniref:Metalloregulator ArsR/SmtB family transcription factor n=2 Tax=Sneathiella chungangensis TaxID=1418234 RepID=A0A845MEX1_9PROT|nr:metalloregulator ArsR/SmtB family transcription factor [Sneathiella chungangensis]
MYIEDMKNSAARASTLMKALSSETRLLLLCRISEGEISVNELADTLDMRPASVSQQLSLLRKDGLVKTRRAGQTIYYSLDGEEAIQVISVLHGLYCQNSK